MFPSVASSGLPLHANETGEPLFLSPYLAKGQWKLGQKKARVDGGQFGKAAAGVESYAGYLTVNAEDCKSNLFFWYFPAVVSCFFRVHISYNFSFLQGSTFPTIFRLRVPHFLKYLIA